MKVNLSNRLMRVADFIPAQTRLLDVGSDHAYLPIYLASHQKIAYAIAGEVVKGPYESAKNNVALAALNSKISVRLASGLEAFDLSDDIGTITICGMGGRLILDILEKGLDKLDSVSRLILQPNNRENELRQWLVEHHFSIVEEDIISENDKIYEILVVEKGEMTLTTKEIQFGPFLLKYSNSVFKDKWYRELNKLTKAYSQIPEDYWSDRAILLEKINLVKEVINEA